MKSPSEDEPFTCLLFVFQNGCMKQFYFNRLIEKVKEDV